MRATLLIITTFIAIQLSAQPRVGFAYYDVDKAYDTVPSAAYNDDDFTPLGRNRWDTERYTHKIKSIAAVLDSMALPLVGLYGVENRQVVRDIAAHCKCDYTFVHRATNSRDGMNFALFYYGDVFFPERVGTGRGFLLVCGAVGDREVAIILTRRARSLGPIVEDLRAKEPDRLIFVAGDLYGIDYNSLKLNEATAEAEALGHGNTVYGGRWQMFDRILVDPRLEVQCDVFAKRWLLNDSGEPKPTFDRNGYQGGTSKKLPIFCYWR